MPVLIGVLLMAVMLSVLAIMPKVVLDGSISAWMLEPSAFVMSSCLLGLVCLSMVAAGRLTGSMAKKLILVLPSLLLMVLFGSRAMMAHHQFEQSVVQENLTVSALVTIGEISDSVPDAMLGTTYRQRASITQLSYVHQLNHHADNAVISSNPFHILADNTASHLQPLPDEMTVLLTANASTIQDLPNLKHLSPNTTARMTLLLEPITKEVSATGFDGNVWLRTRDIHATARILSMGDIRTSDDERMTTRLQQLRQRFRDYFYQDWHHQDLEAQQARAVTLSLLTGDRALISRSTKDLYQLAGISHLLAISGTHVVFLALMLAGLLVAILDRLRPSLYATVARWQIRLLVMVVVSLLYALFTGFDVPAARTVYMLIIMGMARYLVLPISNLTLLLMVALLMAWFDPYVLWQAGFWLSFVAVLLLMRYEVEALQGTQSWSKIWQSLRSLVGLQIWLFVAMLPVTLLFFGKVSFWGLLVNLFAVSLFGAIIVPLNLLGGLAFMISPSLADVFWAMSSAILRLVHHGFEIALGGNSWLYAPFGTMGFLLAVAGIFVVLCKFLPRYLAVLPAFVLSLMVYNHYFSHQQTVHGAMTKVSLLNVGSDAVQAVLVRHDTQAWLLLADFGAKSVLAYQNVLVDTLKRQGVDNLTGVIVQTPNAKLPELVAGIHEKIPIHHYWQAGRPSMTLSQLSAQPCQAGQSHQMDGLSLRALTGWQQIADETVWGCTIEIRADDMNVSVPNGESDDGLPSTLGRVIINGAHHDNAWRLWQMLCVDDSLNISPMATNNDGLWLSHRFAKDSDEIVQRFLVQRLSSW